MRIDESWIIDNFDWADHVGLVSDVVYERDERIGFFIRIFLDNMYADYTQYCSNFPCAWEIAREYHIKKKS